MKNKKLNLEDLKIQSFVTSLNQEDANTVKGGVPTAAEACNNTALCSDHQLCSVVDACPTRLCGH